MKNLKIKKALKTMILLGSSLVLIPSIGCSEAETIEVVEVVDNTNEVNETPIITVEPTIKPTQTPEPTATTIPSPAMIPEPALEDRKYCYDLTEEELIELETQISDLYDDMLSDEFAGFYLEVLEITKEELVNYIYLYDGRTPKYDNEINNLSPAINMLNDLICGINTTNFVSTRNDSNYEWRFEELLSKFYPTDTEEYRIIRNIEMDYHKLSKYMQRDEVVDYFLKYVDLVKNKSNDEMDISNLSKPGLLGIDLLLESQSEALFELLFDRDIRVDDSTTEGMELYVQLSEFFIKDAAILANDIIENKTLKR